MTTSLAAAPPLLEVAGLTVAADGQAGRPLVDALSFAVEPGASLGLVGESGCGKSLTCAAVLGLLPRGLRLRAGRIAVGGNDIAGDRRAIAAVRGRRVGMIFQDPSASLNPLRRAGPVLAALLARHRGLEARRAKAEAVALLAAVGIAEPERRYLSYPHELSGGQCQRVMIAAALAGDPDLLIADEPTTALDVTTQAQILALIAALRQRRRMGLLIVSHDLGVIAANADRVAVMYAGRIVEEAATGPLFAAPRHPYTAGLIASVPPEEGRPPLTPIPGQVPPATDPLLGCAFADRCCRRLPRCRHEPPALTGCTAGRRLACHNPVDAGPGTPA